MAAKRNLNRWAPWIFLAALLAFWELGVRLFGIDEFVLPSASSSFRALYDNFGPIMQNTWPTFWTTMVGFGLGIVVGALLGVIIGSSAFMYAGLFPLLVAFNAIPKAAFVPILIVWFGIGVVPAYATAVGPSADASPGRPAFRSSAPTTPRKGRATLPAAVASKRASRSIPPRRGSTSRGRGEIMARRPPGRGG